MGIGMALNLQRHLAAQGMPSLRYSNRTLSRGEPLKEAGAVPEEDFEAVLEKSSIVFTMVSTSHRPLSLTVLLIQADKQR